MTDRPTCGATAVFWPDDEACEAECMLPRGHQPAGRHEDEVLGEWTEDELNTWTPPELPEAVIFDVDGTLCDVRSVRHLIDAKGFDAFHRASASCPPHPHVVDAALAAQAAGRAILVVTGRVEKWRRLTSMWLALHEVPSDELLMRADGDFRKDYVIKREILRRLRGRYDIVHAWDDNPAVLKLWADEGIPATVVPGWDA